jgi:hypothetical protein
LANKILRYIAVEGAGGAAASIVSFRSLHKPGAGR